MKEFLRHMSSAALASRKKYFTRQLWYALIELKFNNITEKMMNRLKQILVETKEYFT